MGVVVPLGMCVYNIIMSNAFFSFRSRARGKVVGGVGMEPPYMASRVDPMVHSQFPSLGHQNQP